MNTTASAQGNASAALFFMESELSSEIPFRTELTDEELGLHRYFNDRILGLMEQRESALTPNPIEIERLSDQRIREFQDALASAQERGASGAIRHYEYALFGYSPTENAERASNLEQQIVNYFDHIRSQYRERATQLWDGVEDMRPRATMVDEAIDAENARRERAIWRPMSDANRSYWLDQRNAAIEAGEDVNRRRAEVELFGHALEPGEDLPEWSPTSNIAEVRSPGYTGLSPELDQARVALENYDRIYAEYRQLEEGLFVKDSDDLISEIVFFFAALVLPDIIAFGITRFVSVASGALRARQVSGANRIRAANGLPRRYMDLAPESHAKLDELFETRRATPASQYADDGLTAPGRPVTRATPRCAVSGVVCSL